MAASYPRDLEHVLLLRSGSRLPTVVGRPCPTCAASWSSSALWRPTPIRPCPGPAASIPAMFAGWLVSELAPHFIAGTASTPRWSSARGGSDRRARPARARQHGRPRLRPRGRAARSQPAFESRARRGPRRATTATDLESASTTTSTGRRRCASWCGRSGCPCEGIEVVKDVATPPTTAGAASSTSTGRRATCTGAPGPAPGARRRLDDRQQGPAGPAADEAHGLARLGVRRDQLPAQPARRLPRAHRRRQARDRLDPRARRGVRRATRRSSRSPAARPAAT